MGTRRSRHNKGRKARDEELLVIHLTCQDCFAAVSVAVKPQHAGRYNRGPVRCKSCAASLGPAEAERARRLMKPRDTQNADERAEAIVAQISALASLPCHKAATKATVTALESSVRGVQPRPQLPDIGDMTPSRRKLFSTWSRLRATPRGTKWLEAHICERWRTSFDAFADDVGERPTARHQLRRLDESKPYGPDNCAWFTVDDERRSRLKVVPLAQLQNDIVRPGIEKMLVPLALYKGTRSIGHLHRMWNFVIAMMHTECTSFADGVHIAMNPEFSHLCGPIAKPQTPGLRSILTRMKLNPKVTDNILGLTEYVRELMPYAYELTPVSLYADRNTRLASWRIPSGAKEAGRGNVPFRRVRSQDLFYPFVMHESGAPMDRLVAIVHACVPPGLPSEFRADVCQDLIVELLAGDLTEDALTANPRKYVQPKLKHYRFDRWTLEPLETEMIDVLQHDEAKRRFDEYVEQQLSDVFRVTNRDGSEQWAEDWEDGASV